jgi:hypothetical protein
MTTLSKPLQPRPETLQLGSEWAELNATYWILVRPILEKAKRAIALERVREELR